MPKLADASPRTSQQTATIAEIVASQAAVRSEAEAVVDGDRTLTYRDLDLWTSSIASRLRNLGVGREVVVALLLPRSVRFVAAALGVLRSGGAYLPLDAGYPRDSLAFMLRDSACAVVITDQGLAGRVPAGNWQEFTLEHEPPVDAPTAERARAAPVETSDLAYLIYTSGSTGRPKGVEITHRSLLNLCTWHRTAFRVTAADRATQIASPAFDAAVWELWPHLSAGASVHIPDEEAKRDPKRLRDWLVAQGITITFLPTSLAEIAIQQRWPEGTALRTLLTGADTLRSYPPPGLPFTLVNNYGPSECTVVTTSGAVPSEGGQEGLPPIGWAIANVRVHVLDGDLRPLPTGAPGELYVGGEGLARGYRNRPELTARSFVDDPFQPGSRLYRTGDIVALRPDGQLAFFGRTDNQVKIQGFRVELDEVAAALMRHAGVASAVVGTRKGAGHEVQLIAYVVAAAGSAPSAAELRSFLATQLPVHMVPGAFVQLEAMPLTPNGKVDQDALPRPDSSRREQQVELAAPRTPLEERVAEIVAELLRLDRVGVGENFFLLGGHSLLGTQLISRIREAYGVELPLRSLFDNPTVEAMSAEVERLLVARVVSMSEEEVRELFG